MCMVSRRQTRNQELILYFPKSSLPQRVFPHYPVPPVPVFPSHVGSDRGESTTNVSTSVNSRNILSCISFSTFDGRYLWGRYEGRKDTPWTRLRPSLKKLYEVSTESPTLGCSYRSNRRGVQSVGTERRESDHVDCGRTSGPTGGNQYT